ncbi:MAG: divergent polysaccharide deacetylase family protein [Janthinobacterium lividum]
MRALLVFWAAVFGLAAASAVTLQVLGPLPHPAPAVADVPIVPQAKTSEWDGRIADPNPALLEPGHGTPPGMLPRIATDGRMPRQVYARPVPPSDGRPRIALILAGFGAAEADSRTAIGLPGPITFAVSAYGRNQGALLAAARVAGHELLASVPMEPERFPGDDAGRLSLLTGASPEANQAMLETVMGRIQGYVGLTGASDGLRGERFAAEGGGLPQVLAEAARRGLLYLDPRPPAPGVMALPAGTYGAVVDVVIDAGDPPARAEVEGRLVALERLARERGTAIGLAGRLRPVTLERIAAWARDAEARGFVLVPISAVSGEKVDTP